MPADPVGSASNQANVAKSLLLELVGRRPADHPPGRPRIWLPRPAKPRAGQAVALPWARPAADVP
eukprot:4152367-Pyramimonas_sp.AAC.1